VPPPRTVPRSRFRDIAPVSASGCVVLIEPDPVRTFSSNAESSGKSILMPPDPVSTSQPAAGRRHA